MRKLLCLGTPPCQCGEEVPFASMGFSLLPWRTLAGSPPMARRAACGAFIHLMGVLVFRNVAILPMEVAALMREEIVQRAYAHTQDPGDL